MKVSFRRVRAGDLVRLNGIVNDPPVARFLQASPPVSMKSTRELFRRSRGDNGWYAVVADGRVVGSVSLRRKQFSKNAHVADFGIALAKEYWGMGLGGAAIDFIIKKAKAAGISRVELEVHAKNARARRLYRQRGFRVEGRKRKAVRCSSGYDDSVVMGRLLR